MKMKVYGAVFLGFLVCIGIFIFVKRHKEQLISPVGQELSKVTEKPLDKYAFERLHAREFNPSVITFGKKIKEGENFTSTIFYYQSDGKKISGLMNIPKKAGKYPVLVLFRGFVPIDIYAPGVGTARDGEYFAQAGYITLAPDFLGYGESDKPGDVAIEDRFETYTTALSLLASLKNINQALSNSGQQTIQADPAQVGIWGHSNGGHIALAVLAITGKSYPTVLWNPVSSVFPYSILYFIDEFDDHGKALIKVVANFEKEYDAEKYSPPNYYKWINAPIQLHQALEDEEVPVKWSNNLYSSLKQQNLDITYFTYSKENHNFNNGSWSLAIQRILDFYNAQFSK